MTANILYDWVLRFIRGSNENVELALLVAEVVAKRKEETKTHMIECVRQGLSGSSAWRVEERGARRFERLILRRMDKSDWSGDQNLGIWFMWQDGSWGTDGACGLVGVEWPEVAASCLKRYDLRKLFTNAREGREGGVIGATSENKEWFALCPGGSDWVGWDHLLTKSDPEIKQFATEVAALMKRLTAEIDRLDP